VKLLDKYTGKTGDAALSKICHNVAAGGRARPHIGAKDTLATYFSLMPRPIRDRTLLPYFWEMHGLVRPRWLLLRSLHLAHVADRSRA
jgi:hypothetical protein